MLLHLFLTNFLTLVVAIFIGMLAEAYNFKRTDYIARVVAFICIGLFIVFGYYAIWQL